MSKNVILPSGEEITVYDVACTRCTDNLEFTAKVDDDGDIRIEAGPCESCLSDRETEGYDEGHEEGLSEADGDYDDGYEQGKTEGIQEARDECDCDG